MQNQYSCAMADEQEGKRIKLLKPQWEVLAVQIATGTVKAHAYKNLYPNCSTPAASVCRLLRLHPEIMDRIEQVRNRMENEAIGRAAMTKASVEDALLENIEHAKKFGKVIRDRDGAEVSFERNHQAINTSLKLIADVNGLTIKANARKGRDEDTPQADLTVDQILRNIKRLYKTKHGKKMDAETLEVLDGIADAERSPGETGVSDLESVRILRPIPEAEGVS